MTFPAFKEWHVIVEALGVGEQILLLRKGGIAEGRGGFQIAARRFWLFPTRFHEQLDKTKPAAARWFEAVPTAGAGAIGATVKLQYFADVVQTAFLDNWDAVRRLDVHHFWTESTLRERFDWSRPPGLHAIVVRTHKLLVPLSLPVDASMAGCKSWIELPCGFDAQPSSPVLADSVFADRLAGLSL
jgi:hypothetical protein